MLDHILRLLTMPPTEIPPKSDAVIAALAPDDARARSLSAQPLIRNGDLQRGVHRLGSGVAEEHVIDAFGRDLHQRIGQLERRRMAHLEGRRVIHLFDLRATPPR